MLFTKIKYIKHNFREIVWSNLENIKIAKIKKECIKNNDDKLYCKEE